MIDECILYTSYPCFAFLLAFTIYFCTTLGIFTFVYRLTHLGSKQEVLEQIQHQKNKVANRQGKHDLRTTVHLSHADHWNLRKTQKKESTILELKAWPKHMCAFGSCTLLYGKKYYWCWTLDLAAKSMVKTMAQVSLCLGRKLVYKVPKLGFK